MRGLGAKTLREVREFISSDTCRHDDEKARVLAKLDAMLKPSLKAKAARSARAAEKKTRKAAKAFETSEIRRDVFERANHRCEFCRVRRATEMHHAFGRVWVEQSASNCLALCHLCHVDFTDNQPSAAACWCSVAVILKARGDVAAAEMARNEEDYASAKAALTRSGQ